MTKIAIALLGSLLTAGGMAGAAGLPGGPFTVEESAAGYASVLGLDRSRRDFAFDATLYRSNRPGNLFHPGERPELTIQIRNLSGQPLAADGHWILIPWANRQYIGSQWHSRAEKLGDEILLPVSLDLPPGGYADFTVSPELPERFGGYALLLDLGESHGRRFISSLARVPEVATSRVQFPLQSAELLEPAAMKRAGLNAVRFPVAFDPAGTPEREHTLAELRRICAMLQENNIVATVEIGAGHSGWPMGMVRPHLTAEDVMIPATKCDYVWHPAHDRDFGDFVADIVREYGFPAGPVNSVKLWNEPWEGLSISGWQADLPRYRELYRIMGEATRRAEKESGNEVLVGGCDSSSNTFDKLFPDGSDEFMPWFDFCSIHYQGLSAPSTVKSWMNRPGRRVLIWDTESWTANTDDTLALVIAANRAAGYDRSMGFYAGYAFGNYDNHSHVRNAARAIMTPEGERQVELPLIAYPMAAALTATQKFIGNREFAGLVFPDGLPWIFAFAGLEGKAEDATLVIGGDLAASFPDYALYSEIRPLAEAEEKAAIRSRLEAVRPDTPTFRALSEELQRRHPLAQIHDGNLIDEWAWLLRQPWPWESVEFRFAASPDDYRVFDIYGNEYPPDGGEYLLSLGRGSWFVRSRRPGGGGAMTAAVSAGQLYGLEPVQLKIRDFTDPVSAGARTELILHNLLNRKISGLLAIDLAGLETDCPPELELAPFETRIIPVAVTGGTADADNLYPVKIRFDAGTDGVKTLDDTLRVNRIAHLTIEVDGDLADWDGVLPHKVSAQEGMERSKMEAAWLPFEELGNTADGGQAEVRLAADENFFYFCCQVNDIDPEAGKLPRFSTLDDDEYYYPVISYSLDPQRTFTVTFPDESSELTARCGVEAPDGSRLAATVRPEVERMRFNLELPEETWTDITAYFPYGDFRSNRNAEVRIVDPADGRVLASQRVWRLKDGGFFTFRAAGKTALEVVNIHPWQPESGRLAGVFADRTDMPAPSGAQAEFVSVDEDAPGIWRGRFGRDGWMLPGAGLVEWPGEITVARDDGRVFNSHQWPEDVRRFTYRKWPVLPDGTGYSNIQIAFNSIPASGDPVRLAQRPGTPMGFINYRTSDREFALNAVSDEYGGGTEIVRLERPDMPRKHFYPRQPEAGWEGSVEAGRLVIRHQGPLRIVEAAIPWGEMPEVKALRDAGKPVKFSFRANRAGGSPVELARGRSMSFPGGMSFHPDWKPCYANEIEFAFE